MYAYGEDDGLSMRKGIIAGVLIAGSLFGIGYGLANELKHQESLQSKVNARWAGYYKDGGKERIKKEIESNVASVYQHFSDSVDLEKKVLALPDEIKVGDRAIDLVDSGEAAEYRRKETVRYIFSIGDKKTTEEGLPIPEIVIVLGGFSNEKYKSSKEALSKTSEISEGVELKMDSLVWAFGLAEAEKLGVGAYSVKRINTRFWAEEVKDDGGTYYAARFNTVPEVTFYFDKKNLLGKALRNPSDFWRAGTDVPSTSPKTEWGQNIYKIANSRRK